VILAVMNRDGMVNFLKFGNREAYAFRFKFGYDKINVSKIENIKEML
jgi:hypothetical protein